MDKLRLSMGKIWVRHNLEWKCSAVHKAHTQHFSFLVVVIVVVHSQNMKRGNSFLLVFLRVKQGSSIMSVKRKKKSVCYKQYSINPLHCGWNLYVNDAPLKYSSKHFMREAFRQALEMRKVLIGFGIIILLCSTKSFSGTFLHGKHCFRNWYDHLLNVSVIQKLDFVRIFCWLDRWRSLWWFISFCIIFSKRWKK